MFLRKLKPLHGWRIFAGEVGIIVLGVLIALGAEQAVRKFNQRAEVRELREAVDKEIGFGIGAYQSRLSQERCLQSRLQELERWLQGWRAGKPQNLIGPILAPLSGPANTNVWESREPAVMSEMPLELKLAYGSIYDEFSNNEVQRLDERMTWLALAEYDGATALDNASMMRLQGLITRARWRARNLMQNTARIAEVAHDMGIEPLPDPLDAAQVVAMCQPILPKP